MLKRKFLLVFITLFIVAGILLCSLSALALTSGTNLTSNVEVIDITLADNQTATQQITLSSAGGASFSLEVDGLSQNLQGATTLIPSQQDTASNSARSFITLDTTSVNIPAGGSQNVNATIRVPAGTPPGERYASIYVYSQPSSGQSVNTVTGLLIPVIVNTAGYTPVTTGNITSFNITDSVSQDTIAYTGKALNFNTIFNNTGNCRMTGVNNLITVKDSSGNAIWQNQMAVPAPSLLPNTPRIITNTYNVGLNKGSNYSVTSEILLGSTVLDAKTISFNVIDPPPLPATPGVTSPGSSTVPGPVIDTLTPTFQWSAASSATYYTLTITRNPYGASNVVYTSGQLSGTSFTLPSGILFGGQQYAWQVNATNDTGTGPASTMYYFQTPGSSVPPQVSTGVATNVSATGATLNGSLTSLGSASNVQVNFQYGINTNYGKTTTAQSLTGNGNFSFNILNLIPGTTYHFRAIALGSDTVYGNDVTFETLAATTTTTTSTTTITPSTVTTTVPQTVTTTVPTTIPQITTETVTNAVSPSPNISDYLLPGMDSSSLVMQNFTNSQNPSLDALQQANTAIALSGTRGDGSIILGRYYGEPAGHIAFSAGVIKGGTGKPAIKFVDARVKGYAEGTARVTVIFTDRETTNFDPTTLFLAYYSGEKWIRCDNNTVSLSGHAVSGDIPIIRLTGTIIGLGGSHEGSVNQAGGVAPYVNRPNSNSGGYGISWSLAGIIVVPIIVIGIVILVIYQNRRKTQDDSQKD